MVDEQEQQRQDECKTEYDVCMNEVERHQTWRLLVIWFVVTGIAVTFHLLSAMIFAGEGMVFTREMVLNIIPDVIYSVILMTSIVIFDWVTPGATLKRATSEPLSAAIVIGSFVLGLSYIMAAF
jgi:hypothetical protein